MKKTISYKCNAEQGCGKQFKKVIVLAPGVGICHDCFKKIEVEIRCKEL